MVVYHLRQEHPIRLYQYKGGFRHTRTRFLAATKQLYEWFSQSVCPSVRPSHLFDYVSIIVSSWNFQELLPMTEVTSMQKSRSDVKG